MLDTATSAEGMLTLRPWARAATTEGGLPPHGKLVFNLATFEMVIWSYMFIHVPLIPQAEAESSEQGVLVDWPLGVGTRKISDCIPES